MKKKVRTILATVALVGGVAVAVLVWRTGDSPKGTAIERGAVNPSTSSSSTSTSSTSTSSVAATVNTLDTSFPTTTVTQPVTGSRAEGPIDEDAVRAFALKTIDDAWVNFSRTFSPKPLVAAKRAIMRRFPGVEVSFEGDGMELRGAVSLCFAPDDRRATGPGMMTEVPCG